MQFHYYSVKRGVGYFFFENGLWQQFQLQLCETSSSIKCYITVQSNKPTEAELHNLLQQRRALVNYLRESLTTISHSHMPSAKKPVVFLDCPLAHPQDCPPHLTLDIDNQALLICQCNESRVATKIDEKYYIQLFEAIHIHRNCKFACHAVS